MTASKVGPAGRGCLWAAATASWGACRPGSGDAAVLNAFWLRAALSAGVLVVLLARMDAREASRAVTFVDLRLWLAAIAVEAVGRAVMIARWTVLLRAAGSSVSVGAASRIFLVASFIGTALPAGGADVARAYGLSRELAQRDLAVASVVVDRVLGLAALLTLGAAGLALGIADAALPLARPMALGSLAAAVSILATFGADRLASWLLPSRLRQSAAGRRALRVADEMARYRTRYRTLVSVFALSLVVQWLRVVAVFLLGAGLGLDVRFGYYLIFMPIALTVFMLPVSIAGLGLPQGVIVWLLQPIGVPDPQSFALSTLVVVLGLLGSLPGCYLYLRARGGLT